ncbi:hypothetical protein COCVIDRAFT_108474, partial [Bipolaris victoriae FI3]
KLWHLTCEDRKGKDVGVGLAQVYKPPSASQTIVLAYRPHRHVDSSSHRNLDLSLYVNSFRIPYLQGRGFVDALTSLLSYVAI